MRRLLPCAALLLLLLLPAPTRPALAAEPDSPEALVQALYESSSGAAGQPHDWTRFRSLFLPGARIVALVRDAAGRTQVRDQGVDDYVAQAGPRLQREGFRERGLSLRTLRYGDLVQAWSAYEATHGSGAQARVVHGVNALQLTRVDGHWRIAHLLWANERSAGPLPAEWLEAPPRP